IWQVQVFYRTGSTEREVPVQLTATLFTEVTVQPAALTVFTEHAVTHEMVVTDLRPQPLSITAVQTTAARLTAQPGQPAKDSQGHWSCKVHLQVAEDYPEGRREEAVSIYTSDPAYPELHVPVTVIKRPRQLLSAAPAQVQLTAPAGQAVPSRLVLI